MKGTFGLDNGAHFSFAAGVPRFRGAQVKLLGAYKPGWKPIRFSWQGLHGHKTIAHGNGLEGDTVETGRPIFSKNGAATELPVKVTEPNQHYTSDRISDTRKMTAARTLNTVEEIKEHEN